MRASPHKLLESWRRFDREAQNRKSDPRKHTKSVEIGFFLVLLRVVWWIVDQVFGSLGPG